MESNKKFNIHTADPNYRLFILFSSGVATQDLLGILKILSKKRWFTSDIYNQRLRLTLSPLYTLSVTVLIILRDFPYDTRERGDKPRPVSLTSGSSRLSGKAMRYVLVLSLF